MGKNQVLGTGDYENLKNSFSQAQIEAAQSLNVSVGFKRSAKLVGSVASGAAVGEIEDFLVPYGFLVLRIPSCEFLQASTKLRLDMGMDGGDSLCRLFDLTLNSADLATLPNGAGTSFQMVIPQAMGFQRARITLSLATSGGAMNYEMYGLDLVSS